MSGAEQPGRGGLSAAIAAHLERYFANHEGELPPCGLYDRVLREVEAPLLTETMKMTRGNQSLAAKILGLNRNTLKKKLQMYHLDAVRWR